MLPILQVASGTETSDKIAFKDGLWDAPENRSGTGPLNSEG